MIEGTVASGVDWDTLWLAIGLLVLAVALLLLELLVVSLGLLAASALAAAAASIYFAFEASDAAGWIFTVTVPILAAMLVRWGVARIRASRNLVPQSEVTAEAGYHHHTDSVGAVPGAVGVMVTPARPSGRARFEDGECDVQAQSGTLERDQRVVVRHIDGPIVFVAPVADEPEP